MQVHACVGRLDNALHASTSQHQQLRFEEQEAAGFDPRALQPRLKHLDKRPAASSQQSDAETVPGSSLARRVGVVGVVLARRNGEPGTRLPVALRVANDSVRAPEFSTPDIRRVRDVRLAGVSLLGAAP